MYTAVTKACRSCGTDALGRISVQYDVISQDGVALQLLRHNLGALFEERSQYKKSASLLALTTSKIGYVIT